ncbi:serine hydrolase [Flavobacterium sp.]
MKFLKSKKFSLLHLIILSFAIALITFGLTDLWESNHYKQLGSTNGSQCKIDVKRLNGLQYTKPIMFEDDMCESDELSGLKQRVSQIIERYRTSGDVNVASFYLRKCDNSDWTGLNDGERYRPASLLKIPVLMTILKMNEDNPGFLNKKLKFETEFEKMKNVAFTSKSIKLGESYTVKELLSYMIKYSDNNATLLLENNMELKVFRQIFEDFGLPSFNPGEKYYISAKEYSYFMSAIYNAAYLTIKDSEFAAELLTQSNFRSGIVKELPEHIKVAHKFGEAGNDQEKQLHESAIVYLNDNPYLLTVMTKGRDNQKLSELISEISQAIYLEMQNSAAAVM